MRVRNLLFALLLAAVPAGFAQTATAAPSPTATTATSQTTSRELAADLTAYGELLGRLQALAQRSAADLGQMRIDKWKTDSNTKKQAQQNMTALQRNLTAALPEIIQKAQAAPQDLGPNFTLYRNLDVLYDVMSATAENAGAFGPKDQYQAVATDTGELDQIRRSMADRLAWLTGIKDQQVTQLRQQLASTQQELQAEKKKAEAEEKPAKKPAPHKKKKAAK